MRHLLNSTTNVLNMPHLERRMLVAQRMKEARLHSGMSQRDIAKELHIGAATYCRMERGESEPSAVQITTLSGLYGVTVLWLLGLPNFVVTVDQSSSSSSS